MGADINASIEKQSMNNQAEHDRAPRVKMKTLTACLWTAGKLKKE